MSIMPRQEDERSQPLRPFAPNGQTINVDVHGNPTLVSYTYPADYGEKMNSVGLIGDRSLAGHRVEQYGTVLDRRTLFYLLSDSDVQTLLRWMPTGWNLPKIRGILLVEFHRTSTDLPSLTWQDIIAMLNTRSPVPADENLKAEKVSAHRIFISWLWIGPYRAWCYIVEHKLWSRVAGSLIAAVILVYLSHKYAWFSRR